MDHQASPLHSVPSAFQELGDIALIFFAIFCSSITFEGWVDILIEEFFGVSSRSFGYSLCCAGSDTELSGIMPQL